jgi:hypothetical protein
MSYAPHIITYNREEFVVHNAHLQTLAPQVEVANSVVWRCGGSGAEKKKKLFLFDASRARARRHTHARKVVGGCPTLS